MSILRASSIVSPTVFVSIALALAAACGGGESSVSAGGGDSGVRGPEPAGQSCSAPAECYPGIDGGTFSGQVTCLEKVPGGYCTHTCTQDSECCAVSGECRTAVKQVCSPFENQPQQYCLLSCEDEDIAAAIAEKSNGDLYDGGATDAGSVADAYCQSFAGSATSCRSSGGGSKNRKVCIPKE